MHVFTLPFLQIFISVPNVNNLVKALTEAESVDLKRSSIRSYLRS